METIIFFIIILSLGLILQEFYQYLIPDTLKFKHDFKSFNTKTKIKVILYLPIAFCFVGIGVICLFYDKALDISSILLLKIIND